MVDVSKVWQRKKYYEEEYLFEDNKSNFETIEGSVSMKEGIGNCVVILKLNVIPESQASRLYEIAFVLELFGNAKSHGKKIGVYDMVMYGMYENHHLGWYYFSLLV